MVSHGSKRRVYTQHSHRGFQSLKTWIQDRCFICGRFLGLKQIKFCGECSRKRIMERRNYQDQREYQLIRSKFRYNPDRFNIGDLV